MRRKPFAILRYLAEHPQRLVTQEELVLAVWGTAARSESLLRTHIRELRHALGDGIIETVVGRGYHFIPKVTSIDEARDLRSDGETPCISSPPVVGRGDELATLQACLAKMLRGERQIVFIAGEAGIGKTTLVDGLLKIAALRGPIWLARGRCIEQYGSSEPYLPVLEACSRLCRGGDAQLAANVLARHAPTWLAQLPSLIPDDQLTMVERRASGASQARMLRELAEALEVLGSQRPVILTLDDLHWSDHSTVELISMLGARPEPARLLVLCAYRRADLVKTHPLTKTIGELGAHRQATMLSLEPITPAATDQYLTWRFPQHDFPEGLGLAIHRTTGGNPLFMVALLDELESHRLVVREGDGFKLVGSIDDVASSRPETVKQLIDTQLDRTTLAEQRVLEAASVAGDVFTAAIVAEALELPIDEVDDTCERLAQQGRFFRRLSPQPWPDGTTQTAYAFVHVLYRHAAFARVQSAARRHWHRRISERLEAAYGKNAWAIAADLAIHFEEGRNFPKAAHYYIAAGERALVRFARADAIRQFERARRLIAQVTETQERDELELRLLRHMTPVTAIVHGQTSLEVLGTFIRASDLAERLGDDSTQMAALLAQQVTRLARAELRQIAEHDAAVQEASERLSDHVARAQAQITAACAAMMRGELRQTEGVLEEAHAAALVYVGDAQVARHGIPAHPAISSATYLASLVAFLGRADAALDLAEHNVARAETIGEPHAIAMAYLGKATVHRLRRDYEATFKAAQRLIDIGNEHGIPLWANDGMALVPWALAHLDSQLPSSFFCELEGSLVTRMTLPSMRPTLAVNFAEICAILRKPHSALREIAEAIAHVERTGNRLWEAELYRLRGEFMKDDDRPEAERCFQRAVAIAAEQSSLFLELRAAMSLCRLVSGGRKLSLARRTLEKVCGSFTEALGLSDLVEARALLAGFKRPAGQPRTLLPSAG